MTFTIPPNPATSTDDRSSTLRGWTTDRAKERGSEKRRTVLDWVYRWGYASASTIVEASGAADRGYPQRLVKQGLIRPVPTTRCPTTKKIFVLTVDGLDIARSSSILWLEYPELDSRRINQANVTHNLTTQEQILRQLPNFSGWKSDREFGQNIEDNKRPDGALIDGTGRAYGLEIELSGKWSRRLDQMSIRIIAGIAKQRFAGFQVLCATEAMAQRYKVVFAPGFQIPRWEPGASGSGKFFTRGHWEPIPKAISEAIWVEALPGMKR